MAAKSPLKDIEETFFMYSICLDNFKEPKLLPCLHRYCRDCLNDVIKDKQFDFECPLCNHICEVPPNGVDGYKTDFHIKNVVEFIQLQKTFESEEVRECAGCSEQLKITAYCFKCNGFLCDQCYNLHITKRMLRDHRQNVLDLKDVVAQSLSLEKLANLAEAPRCDIHAEKLSELCCGTCGNIPICVVCGLYGQHKGHSLHDVTELAKTEREKLKATLAILDKYAENLYNLPKKIHEIREKLEANTNIKKEKLISQHQEAVKKINRKIKETDENLETVLQEIESKETEKLAELENEKMNEMQTIIEKFSKLVEEEKMKNQKKRHEEREYHKYTRGKFSKEFRTTDNDLKDLQQEIDVNKSKNITIIDGIMHFSCTRMSRCDNVKASSSSILASKNEWTEARCLTDIRTASERLIEDVKTEFPELESLSDYVIRDLSPVIVDNVTITKQEESVVDIGGIKANGWYINDMTTSGDGGIVTTGRASDGFSHITITNMKGGIVRQDEIAKVEGSNTIPNRYCAFFSNAKIASACHPDQIGIYDVRDGSYIKKNISNVFSNFLARQYVTCVATDLVNKLIIVGSNNRDVYMFDDQLNHSRTLPEVIEWPRDVTLHGNHLLICDWSGSRAYTVTMEESGAKLVHEFIKPDLDGGFWRPRRLSTDMNGFIYILWDTDKLDRSIIVQYSQDGRQLLTTKPVDENSRFVTTLNTDEGEKLLIATRTSGKMYTYGLLSTAT